MMTKAELIDFLVNDHDFENTDEVVIVDNGEIADGDPYAELTTERNGERYLYMLPIRIYRAQEVLTRHCIESHHI